MTNETRRARTRREREKANRAERRGEGRGERGEENEWNERIGDRRTKSMNKYKTSISNPTFIVYAID